MADESVGTARVDLTVNVADFNSGIEAAKRQMAGFENASDSVRAQLDGMSAAQRRSVEQMQRQINTLGLGKTGMTAFKIETQSTGAVQEELRRQLAATTKAANESTAAVGMSAKQTAAAMRGIPAQITDITVGLASGQAPLTVLLQQGGQLKDMFGGIAPAAKALGSTLLALVNPYSLVIASVLGLAYAYNEGSKELEGYRTALIDTGSAIGVTTGQMQLMAARMDDQAGTTYEATAALTALVSQNAAFSDNLEKNATAVANYSRITGASVDTIAKSFAALKKDPLDATLKLNEGMNYLSESAYRQIKALSDQGRTLDAARVAQNAYADAINSRGAEVEKNLGSIERGWNSVKNAAKEAWDAMLSVGRSESPEKKLSSLQADLARAEKELASSQANDAQYGDRSLRTAAAEKLVAARKDQVKSLDDSVKLEREGAEAAAARAAKVEALTVWDKEGLKYLSDQKKLELEIAQIRAQGAAAGVSQKDIDARVQAARDKIKKERDVAGDLLRGLQMDLAADASKRANQYDSNLSAFGLGSEEKERMQSELAIIQDFAQRREKFTKQMAEKGLLNSKEYTEGSQEIETALEKAKKANQDYYDSVLKLQSSWQLGAQSALADYLEKARNTYSQINSVVTGAFKGMEDALVSFITTGKADFKSLADSIIADLVRIAVQKNITGVTASFISSFFGSGSTGSVTVGPITSGSATDATSVRAAKGGVYNSTSLSSYSNGVYASPRYFEFAKGAGIFAEAGPEAIMPLTRTSSGDLGVRSVGGSDGVTVNLNITNETGATVQQTGQTQNATGGIDIDLLISQVDNGLADREQAGQSSFGSAIATRNGLTPAVV